MEISRRNVLRFGALSLASVTSPSWARGLFASGTGPATDSVLVLVEGPWLYTQPVTGTMRCTSLSEPHQCQMGLWDEKNGLVSPYDPSQAGPMLGSGAAVVGKLTSSNKRPNAVTIFDAAFNRDDIGGPDNFFYLRNTGYKVKPLSTDRTVTIPVPDNVYVAGRVVDGKLNDESLPPVMVNPTSARLFVSYVFEYTQDSTGSTSLTVDDGSGKTFTLTKGQHLVFQMQAATPAVADVPHITHAFSEMVTRIGTGGLPLSVAFPQATTTATIQMGNNAQGLSAAELGLNLDPIGAHKGHRPKQHKKIQGVGTGPKDPSCQGGGGVILP